jgi:hypothetical protein
MIEHLKFMTAAMDAKFREMQDMTHRWQMQYAPQTQTTGMAPFSPSTTPSFPTNANIPSPYHSYDPSQANINPFPLLDHFAGNSGAPSPHRRLRTATSLMPPMTNVTYSQLPAYTFHIRAGRTVYLCECGHEMSRKGDMTRHFKSLEHSQ